MWGSNTELKKISRDLKNKLFSTHDTYIHTHTYIHTNIQTYTHTHMHTLLDAESEIVYFKVNTGIKN